MAQREIPLFPLSYRGFTLLELLVVVAILSILGAVAIPIWSVLLPTYALNSAVRQVQSELHNIKSRAAAKNANFQLVFSTATYKARKKNGGSWQDVSADKNLPQGIVRKSSSATTLSFTPRGTSSGGTVTLCNTKNTGKNVVVSGTGRIRIQNATC